MELDYFEEVEKLVDKEIITISDSIALKVIGKDSIKNIINLLNNLPELPSRSTLKGNNYIINITTFKSCYLELVRIGLYN